MALIPVEEDELKRPRTCNEASSYLQHLHLETTILSDILERLDATGKGLQAVNIDLSVVAELHAPLTYYTVHTSCNGQLQHS